MVIMAGHTCKKSLIFLAFCTIFTNSQPFDKDIIPSWIYLKDLEPNLPPSINLTYPLLEISKWATKMPMLRRFEDISISMTFENQNQKTGKPVTYACNLLELQRIFKLHRRDTPTENLQDYLGNLRLWEVTKEWSPENIEEGTRDLNHEGGRAANIFDSNGNLIGTPRLSKDLVLGKNRRTRRSPTFQNFQPVSFNFYETNPDCELSGNVSENNNNHWNQMAGNTFQTIKLSNFKENDNDEADIFKDFDEYFQSEIENMKIENDNSEGFSQWSSWSDIDDKPQLLDKKLDFSDEIDWGNYYEFNENRGDLQNVKTEIVQNDSVSAEIEPPLIFKDQEEIQINKNNLDKSNQSSSSPSFSSSAYDEDCYTEEITENTEKQFDDELEEIPSIFNDYENQSETDSNNSNEEFPEIIIPDVISNEAGNDDENSNSSSEYDCYETDETNENSETIEIEEPKSDEFPGRSDESDSNSFESEPTGNRSNFNEKLCTEYPDCKTMTLAQCGRLLFQCLEPQNDMNPFTVIEKELQNQNSVNNNNQEDSSNGEGDCYDEIPTDQNQAQDPEITEFPFFPEIEEIAVMKDENKDDYPSKNDENINQQFESTDTFFEDFGSWIDNDFDGRGDDEFDSNGSHASFEEDCVDEY